MAVEVRPELVGKRFLCVSREELVEPAEIARWRWRAGVIRAVSHRDSDNPDLMVYVEFDDLEWEKREWIKVYEEYRVFLLENRLVWAWRKDTSQLQGSKGKQIQWPALTFRPIVGKAVLGSVTVVEFLSDRRCDFLTDDGAYWQYEDEAASLNPVLRDNLQLHQEVSAWVKEQKVQDIFMRGPYSLNGHRVQVYRQDSATQWFTGIITNHDIRSRMMIVMNDQVLEPQNVDPSMVQMTFLDDVVHSLLKGENIGIASRRRTRTSQNNSTAPQTAGVRSSSTTGSPQGHYTRTQAHSPRPLMNSSSSGPVSQNSPGQQRSSPSAVSRDSCPDSSPLRDGADQEGKDPSQSKSEQTANKRRKPEDEKEAKSDLKRLKVDDEQSDRALGSYSESSCGRTMERSVENESKSKIASGASLEEEQSLSSKRPEEAAPTNQTTLPQEDEETWTETLRPAVCEKREKTPPTPCNINSGGTSESQGCTSGTKGTPGTSPANLENSRIAVPVMQTPVDVIDITEDPGRSSAAEEGSAPPASSKTEPGLSETRPAFSPTSNCRSPESMSHISSSLSAELPYKQSEVIISPRSAGGFPASAEREKPQQFPTALSYVGNNSIAQDGKMSHKPNPSPDVLKPKPSPSPDQTKPTQNPSPEVKSKEHTVQETCKPKSITAPEMAKQKARHHENSVGAASRPASRAELDDSHSGFKPVPTRGPAPEPTKSPLIIDKNQPFTIYRDPALIRSESEASHFSYLHAPHLHPLHPSPRSSCSAPSPHHPSHLLTSPSHIISGPSHILPSPSHTLPSPSHILQSPSPQPSIGSVSAHAIPSIHHPHLLPGMLHGLPPASLLGGHPRLDSAHTGRLGALGLAQPPPPPSPTPASSYNHLGLYPIVWQYPNGSHPYPALGLPSSKWGHPPEGAVSSEPCLRRNSPSPWLHQHAPVTSSSAADSLGLLSHVPVRPSSADPHMTPRVHPHASPPPANLATRVHSHTGSPPANLSSRINPHASPPPANLPSRIQSHTSPPLSKSTEEMEKKAFFEPMQAFTSVYSKLEQDRMRAPGGRDRHLHFLEGLPGQGKQQRAPQESGDRASKYKEESRRILQESIEVAPYTAKIRPSEAERETYPGALPSLPPPSTKRHALHRDTDPSPSTSDLYGLKAPLPRPGYFTTLSNSVVNEPPHPHPHLSQELGSFFERAGPSPLSQPPFSSKAPSSRPPPLIRHQPEGGEGLVGKITEQLSQQHTPPLRPLCVMGNDGRSPLISMSSPSSAPSPLRGMPSLYRAPVFHPPTQHAPSRRLSPPTLTPIQPVSSTGAGLGLGAGVILDQQRPPTLVPELREAGGSGGPHRAPSEGRRSREMGNAKPQSATASVIVRPSVCVKREGSPGSKAVGSNLMDCRDPGGAVLLKGSSEDVSAWYRSCVTETQRAVPGPVMALSNTLLDAKAHAASPAILPPSTIDQGDSVTEHTREKTEFPNPSAGVTSVMEQKEGKVQAPSSSLSYPSRFVHPKKHKAALAAAQSRNTNDNPSEGAKSPPLPSVSLPPQPSPITQGNNSPGNATDKTNCLTNGQPQSAQLSQPNYHKLKKAWLTRHSEEDRNASVKAEKAESSVSEIIKPCTVSLTASTSSHLETGKDDKEQEKEATGQEEGKTRRAAKRSYESGSESAPDDDSDGSQSEQRAKRQPKPTYKKKQNDLRKRRNHNDKEEDGEEEEDGGSKPNAIFRSAKEKIKLKLANSNGIPRSVLKDWRKVRKLKQTGESFLQDDSCCEIGPNLQKCRECRLVRSRKGEETGHSPVFCRFYYFRRLSYSKNGVVKIDGFSFPDQYDDEAVSMWTPSTCEDNELDLETSKYILSYIGDKFCQLAMSENTAATSNKKNASMAWKRAVRGVREMCDACEATLFNLHWVCQKCGFVVCLDCYKAKERKGSKEKDLYSWLKCVKGQPHDHKQLMPTQIIPGTVLTDLVNSMHALREKFGIKSHCACSGKLNKIPSTNGVSQVLQNVLNHSNKMSLCKPHGGQEEPPLKVEAESKQALPESQSPLHFLADLAEQKSREEKKENKESPVGMVVVVKEAQDQNEGVEGLNCKPTAMGISSTEQGSTLRDLLTTTAGKLRMGSTDAGMAFAPVYCSSTQTSKSSRSMPNILDDIIASVVENKIPAGKALRPRPKQEVSEEAQAENRKPGVDDPKTPALPLDSPHTWLYGRRLLWLRDHRHPGNCRLFRESWEQGQPVLVSGVHKKLKASLWKAESFNQEFADHQGDLLNCKDGVVSVSGIKEFWDGFEDLTKRPRCKGGDTAVYRLKDWPSGEEFMALMPSRYDDLMTNLPLPEYSDPEGSLNLASRLPSFFVRPDLGPRLCCAYGVVASQEQDFGTSNLHLEVSDIVSILVYVGVAKGNGVLSKTGVLKRLEEEDLDDKVRKRLKDSSEIPGALWHIYMSKDAEKIKEFLNKVSREQGGVSEQDPIREPGWYLNRKLRQRLLEEQGVQAWTVLQFLGDSVIIPAGALHQVQNLHSCVQVINDFVSPEHVVHSFHLTQELRSSSEEGNYEDKLQVKNIFYHSVKDAVGTLKRCCMEDPDESEDNS